MPFSWVSTAEAMLFHQNTCKTGNNAVEMSQAFHDLALFESFTDLNCLNMRLISFKTGKWMLYKFYSMVLIFCQQTVMVEGDESSRLSIANQPAVLAGYRPLLTAPYRTFILYFLLDNDVQEHKTSYIFLTFLKISLMFLRKAFHNFLQLKKTSQGKKRNLTLLIQRKLNDNNFQKKPQINFLKY